MHQISGNGLVVQSWAQTQWAPTLTSHDPNPPITLEDPLGATGTAAITLDTVVSSAAGSPKVTSSGSPTLDSVTVAGAGGPLAAITGTAAVTLATVVSAASGSPRVNGSGVPTLATVCLLYTSDAADE